MLWARSVGGASLVDSRTRTGEKSNADHDVSRNDLRMGTHELYEVNFTI